MKSFLIILFVAAVTIPLAAQETPDIEREFANAMLAEKEGRHEAAAEAFRRFIEMFPDDEKHTPKAYMHLTVSLVNLKRFDEAKETIGMVRKLYPKDLKRLAWARRAEADINRWAVQLAKREHDEDHDDLAARLEELKKIWERAGLHKAEIEARIIRAREEFERAMANRAKLEKELERLRADGVEGEELHRHMEEIHRRLTEAEEHRWREQHDRGMHEATEEFLRLAGKLGIPMNEAQRLLEKHRRPGPAHHFDPAPAKAVEDLKRRVTDLEERVRRLEEAAK